MSFKNQASSDLMARAREHIPGGVNSPVRAFRNVDGDPLFISRAEGCYIYDADNNRYIDYVGSWGPMILGHASEVVADAIRAAIPSGTSFGAPTKSEVEFAELLCSLMPWVEMIRFVSSGTEATMSAIRLARGFTGRDVIIKCNGCYHGHADALLVKAGSGVATHGIAGSAGVPDAVVRTTVSIEFNDLLLMQRTIDELGAENVAAIIIEPVPGNMGLVLPEEGYLQGLRELCNKHSIVLIFDEVMTGFRVGLTGAAGRYSITPDLLTYGKVIGGGLPVGAFGGRKDIMSLLAPLGPVYQAGTLSGNPLAMAAGLSTIKALIDLNPYARLEMLGKKFVQGMLDIGERYDIPITASSCGSMIGFFFCQRAVRNFSEALESDIISFKKFFWKMLEEGVYLAPSAFEAGFLSIAHDEEILEQTLSAANKVLSNFR